MVDIDVVWSKNSENLRLVAAPIIRVSMHVRWDQGSILTGRGVPDTADIEYINTHVVIFLEEIEEEGEHEGVSRGPFRFTYYDREYYHDCRN